MEPLFNHQSAAIKIGTELGSLAIFHDPGLGKTRTALEIFKTYPDFKLLVICPKSLIKSAWMDDIARFTDFTCEKITPGKIGNSKIYIINYESFISKRYFLSIVNLISTNKIVCVLDESSRLKNHRSLTAQRVLSVGSYFEHRFILTGTPAPNNELEYWAQMNFVERDLLGHSFYWFRNTYFRLERNGQALTGQVNPRQLADYFKQGWKYKLHKRDALMRRIAAHAHFVRKEDALDLPPRLEQIRDVELSAPERAAYNTMRRQLIVDLRGGTAVAQNALVKLMKLRQGSSGFFYDENGVAMETGKSKLNELEICLDELGRQPIIIWAQFRHEIAGIERMISGIYGEEAVKTLYAGTNDRDESIRTFQNNQAQYLIAHPRSAAHGLTFTNCRTMIFYSLDYSSEYHKQAMDRNHRIGQVNSCLYIYLLARQTIDYEIYEILKHKQEMTNLLARYV